MPLSTREDALYKCSIRKVQLNSHYLDCGWYVHQWHELSIVSCVKWLPLWQRWDLSLMVVRSSISVGGVIAVVDVAVVVVAVVVMADVETRLKPTKTDGDTGFNSNHLINGTHRLYTILCYLISCSLMLAETWTISPIQSITHAIIRRNW